LDTTVSNIQFDEDGVCNYCRIHDEMEKKYPLNELGQQKLNQLVNEIKNKGKNKKYDCVIGVSGGIDSTYTLYTAKKLGLRPLAVHVDNGWNSDIAVDNMNKAVTKLGVDLKTISFDWEEFKDLQISFLKASVSDAEIPTDIAILAALHKVAAEESIHYIVIGDSFRTQGTAPIGWTYMDGRYIKSVYKKFGKSKLKNYPNLTLLKLLYYVFVKKIRVVSILEYLDYRKDEVATFLEKELGWSSYGGKHYESIYTRFFQSYLLPKKFNIDKRKTEYSALVRSGQMTRDEALMKIKEENPYPKDKVKEDKEYVIKKLGLTPEEFEEILSSEPKTFLDYPTYYPIIRLFRVPIKLACKSHLLPMRFEKYFR